MFDDTPLKPKGSKVKSEQTGSKRSSKRSGKRAARLPRSIAKQVERVSRTECVVERSAVESILENQQLLMRSVRIEPKRTRNGTRLVLSRVGNGSWLHEVIAARRRNPIDQRACGAICLNYSPWLRQLLTGTPCAPWFFHRRRRAEWAY